MSQVRFTGTGGTAMNRPNQTQPAPEQLRDYALGTISAAARPDLEAHVNDCPECAARLAGVGDDTFVIRLRGASPGETTDQERAALANTVAAVPGAAESSLDLPACLLNHPRYRVLRAL